MNNNINSNNSSRLFKSALLIAALAFAKAFAVPSTAPTNMQVTPGVTFQLSGTNLSFTAPDRSVINWNNFGSGSDAIAAGDVISYRLPSSGSSILNVVNGASTTTINGSIESNANVYILNPNGIVVGNGARIDVNRLTLSTVDSAFAGQFAFLNDGKLPSESGTRTASGAVTIASGASTGNLVALTKDISISNFLSSGNITISADGNVIIGGGSGTVYNTGSITVANPTGNTTIGSAGANVIASNGINVTSTSGSISTVAGANINSNRISLVSSTGDINATNLSSSVVSAAGKNVTVGFVGTANPSVAVTANGTVSVTSPSSLTVSSLANESGASSVSASGRLTLGSVHVRSSLPTAFSGQSVVDSVDGVFIYGPASFAATAGDVSIVKNNHSFGPLSAAATGNVTIFEAGAMNMNNIRGTNVSLKTNEFAFQTPTTASLLATKLSLVAASTVAFYTGTISNGLTINTLGNVDLGKLSLATNLNNVAPTVVTVGTVTNPVP
jgi:filamentous hemagglutinin family protein